MTAPDHQADHRVDHRGDRPRARAGLVLLAVGALLLVARALADTAGAFLVAAALGALVVGFVLLAMGRGTAARHRAVVVAHPGAAVVEVWGSAGLPGALTQDGAQDVRGVRRRQGTALSLVVDDAGLALWAGGGSPRRVHAAAWSDVRAVREGHGVVANDGHRPAVVVLTVRDAALVLLPARVATGSLRTADLAGVRQLVARLDARRADAS